MDKKIEQELLGLVRQNYEEIALSFAETRKKAIWPEIAKFADQVEYGSSVLDVGCGNGRLRSALKNKKLRYVGIDDSQKLVDLAAQNQELRMESQEFIVGDLLSLDKLTREKFDYIFCVAVLHHIPGEELRIKALKQMRGRLKPGGKIILTVWNLWSSKFKFRTALIKAGLLKVISVNKLDWGDIIFDWKKDKVSQRYYHAFIKRGMKKIICRSGLRIERLYNDRNNYYLLLS